MTSYYARARCALWIGHPKAGEYLHAYDKVLTRYAAAGCARRAASILDMPPDARSRLLPLGILEAGKAIAKDPNNPAHTKLQAALKAAER